MRVLVDIHDRQFSYRWQVQRLQVSRTECALRVVPLNKTRPVSSFVRGRRFQSHHWRQCLLQAQDIMSTSLDTVSGNTLGNNSSTL